MINWKKKKTEEDIPEEVAEVTAESEQEPQNEGTPVEEVSKENWENKYIEDAEIEETEESEEPEKNEESEEAEIQPLSKEETLKVFGKKIKAVRDRAKKIFKREKSDGEETVERRKLTDIFSKTTIILLSAAVALVFAVGFFLGWALPVLWS